MQETQSLSQLQQVITNLRQEHQTYQQQFDLEKQDLAQLELQIGSLQEVTLLE